MPTVVGKCRLCLEEAELQLSHLLPRALYRMIGSGTSRQHPDTVQLTAASIKRSSEQARRHLLCRRCEQRLSANGESWVLNNCYRGRDRFRLRAELRNRALLSGSEVEAYSASEAEVTFLVFFCLSVIWRASLCDWVCRAEIYKQIDLGPFQEQFRKFLNSECGVPGRVRVMVLLSASNRPRLEMSLPIAYRRDDGRTYRFHIPGITFVATVGGMPYHALEDQTSILNLRRPILLAEFGDRTAQDDQMRLMGKVPPRGFTTPLLEGTENPFN